MKTNNFQPKNNARLNAFNWTAMTLLFAVTMSASFMSCSKDDDLNETNPNKEQSQPVVFNTHDALAAFQNTIVEMNAEGQVINHIYGEPIDSSDPEHLFIGVDNMEEAKAMFDLWFTNNVVMTPTSKGGVSAKLTDKEGKPQGTIFLNPGTEENHIAEVTASPDTQLKGFRCITFLNNSAWPTNPKLMGAYKWHKFDIVKNICMKDIKSNLSSADQRLNFVCIQGSGNGVKPIFCGISHGMYKNPFYTKSILAICTSKYCPGEVSTPTAFNIQKILHANWNAFVESFKEAAGGPLITGCNYWYDEQHGFWSSYNSMICYNSGYTYGDDDRTKEYYFLFRIFERNDNEIYDGAEL